MAPPRTVATSLNIVEADLITSVEGGRAFELHGPFRTPHHLQGLQAFSGFTTHLIYSDRTAFQNNERFESLLRKTPETLQLSRNLRVGGPYNQRQLEVNLDTKLNNPWITG